MADTIVTIIIEKTAELKNRQLSLSPDSDAYKKISKTIKSLSSLKDNGVEISSLRSRAFLGTPKMNEVEVNKYNKLIGQINDSNTNTLNSRLRKNKEIASDLLRQIDLDTSGFLRNERNETPNQTVLETFSPKIDVGGENELKKIKAQMEVAKTNLQVAEKEIERILLKGPNRTRTDSDKRAYLSAKNDIQNIETLIKNFENNLNNIKNKMSDKYQSFPDEREKNKNKVDADEQNYVGWVETICDKILLTAKQSENKADDIFSEAKDNKTNNSLTGINAADEWMSYLNLAFADNGLQYVACKGYWQGDSFIEADNCPIIPSTSMYPVPRPVEPETEGTDIAHQVPVTGRYVNPYGV